MKAAAPAGAVWRVIMKQEEIKERQTEIICFQADIIDEMFLLLLQHLSADEIPMSILTGIQDAAAAQKEYCDRQGRTERRWNLA